jgi:hypothetical protein
VPGLFTFDNASNHAYALGAIPPGTYITWASYRNDGYVMDPDWIRKNGLPRVSFAAVGQDLTMDFSVTDAIIIESPTNPPDSIQPCIVATTRPVLRWTRYPSTHEYIVEVFDNRGARIWGGWDGNGDVRHAFIDSRLDSVAFNFDGSATDTLEHGGTYRWKVYADGETDRDSLDLISASEDLLGLFTVDTTAAQ